jgi:hypothetical protein
MHPVRPWNAHKIPLGIRSNPNALRQTGRLLRPAAAIRERLRASSIAADLLAFTVGLTLSFTVKVVGELPIAELITLLLLPPLLIMKGRRLDRTGIKSIYVLMALWLGNQIFTDIYRGTASIDWMRGNAGILFFATNLAFLTILLARNQRRKIVFIVAFAIGSLLVAWFLPSQFAEDDPWKFGYSTGVNLLAVLASSYLFHLRRYLFSGIVLLGIVAVNLKENFRSPILLLLIAIVLTVPIIPERIADLRLLPRNGSMARVAILVTLVTVAAWASSVLVRMATNSSLVSEEAQAKNQTQLQAGLLLGGRPEILVSSRAVLEHPIAGWGSWARDYKYVEMLSDIQADYGIQTDLVDAEEDQGGLIPTHSHLMGAWVWAGIFGAIFWIYIFQLTCKALLQISIQQPPLALFYAFLLATLLWDILFSPFQASRRGTEAFLLVVLIDFLKQQDFKVGIFARFSRSGWTRLPAGERQALIQRRRAARLGNASNH